MPPRSGSDFTVGVNKAKSTKSRPEIGMAEISSSVTYFAELDRLAGAERLISIDALRPAEEVVNDVVEAGLRAAFGRFRP